MTQPWETPNAGKVTLDKAIETLRSDGILHPV